VDVAPFNTGGPGLASHDDIAGGVTMTRKTSVVAAIALIALTVLVAAGAMSASAARNDLEHSSAHAIVGTWDVTLTLPGLPPGRVLATFDGDGGTVESANAAPALRGASHGAWERIEPDLFAVSRVFFRFNPQTGASLGTQQVNAITWVAPDGETFTAVSELRDPAGNLVVGGLPGTATGKRIHVERITDQP
jgi:hypothetical protein